MEWQELRRRHGERTGEQRAELLVVGETCPEKRDGRVEIVSPCGVQGEYAIDPSKGVLSASCLTPKLPLTPSPLPSFSFADVGSTSYSCSCSCLVRPVGPRELLPPQAAQPVWPAPTP